MLNYFERKEKWNHRFESHIGLGLNTGFGNHKPLVLSHILWICTARFVKLSWRESIIQTKTICYMPKYPRIQTFIMLISTRFIQWSCFFPNTPWFSASEHLLELFLSMGIPSLHGHACLKSILPLKNSTGRLPRSWPQPH